MPSVILALLAGLGGVRALSVEHTVRAGELSEGEERKEGCAVNPQTHQRKMRRQYKRLCVERERSKTNLERQIY